MSRRFEGRTALVTGGSRGLGRAIAVQLAREGAFVAVGYKSRADAADETLQLIRDAGGDGQSIGFDIADAAATEAAVREIVSARGALDVAVANAGIAEDALATMVDVESFERVVRTNLGGTANTCRSAARAMLPNKRGAIVTVSSIVAFGGSPGQSTYAASKGGIVALTKSLAAELAPKGIRVNCVVPGLIKVGMAARLDHRMLAARKAQIALGRLGEAEEVAKAVAFLAADDASYIIGQSLVVDGGLLG
ncbi:MAG: SDR family oxidoreductase [Polyangiaceae bacterium]|nr:SDR family oxidoreductase [Polyangiaceae bacterium]